MFPVPLRLEVVSVMLRYGTSAYLLTPINNEANRNQPWSQYCYEEGMSCHFPSRGAEPFGGVYAEKELHYRRSFLLKQAPFMSERWLFSRQGS